MCPLQWQRRKIVLCKKHIINDEEKNVFVQLTFCWDHFLICCKLFRERGDTVATAEKRMRGRKKTLSAFQEILQKNLGGARRTRREKERERGKRARESERKGERVGLPCLKFVLMKRREKGGELEGQRHRY
jgi:hypothetical protein